MGLTLALLTVLPLHAQNKPARMPDPGSELELIESTERSEDPLGLDDSTGKDLDRAAAQLPKPKPLVILPAPSQGAALSAIAGLRESAHVVTVKLAQGLAFVKVRLTLASRVKHAAEVAYRMPLPASAVVTRVRVCSGQSCSDALPDPKPGPALKPRAGASIAAESIDDASGHALSLRIAPIAPGASLNVELEYVAEAEWHGGRARFRLEARGYDPNLAPTELHIEAPRLSQISPAAELSADPWTPIEFSASLRESAGSIRVTTSAPCGADDCRREFEVSAHATAPVRPTWLMIDASPSMEGPARGRVGVVLAALLAVLPESTELRVFGFAARASELGRYRAGAAPLTTLADATMLELDAATQLSAALALARPDIARLRPRIVVLSDGLFDTSKRERDALLLATRQGAETFLLAVGDVQPRLSDVFAHTLQLSGVADAASHGSDLSALEDAVAVVVEKTRINGHKAGEQWVREQRPKGDWPLHPGGAWLPHWMRRDRPPPSFRSEPSSETDFIAAIPYVSFHAPVAALDTGLPKESVLSMLRSQLVPQARACLRTDRKGRANYAVGLAFHALFAQREVYEARVEGTIAHALRTCLESILPKLRVPAFSGRIRIRYPIYTEREEEPPVIELEPDVSQQLERAFSGPRALP